MPSDYILVVIAQLLSQSSNVCVNGTLRHHYFVAPYVAYNLLAAVDTVAVGEEEQQDVELGTCQCHRLVVEITFLVVAVDSQPLESDVGLVNPLFGFYVGGSALELRSGATKGLVT